MEGTWDDCPMEFVHYRDEIEVTKSGVIDGHSDLWRRFEPGQSHYLIDGIEVSRDQFYAAMLIQAIRS